jgi:hypothetical protein
MISIEELVGLPEFIENPESKMLKRKANAEFDMQFFDLLPQTIRDILNESEVPVTGQMAANILRTKKFNEQEAAKEIRRIINEFKANYFRSI